MAKSKKITVRGKPRADIDPLVFLQVLLTVGDEWENQPSGNQSASPDAHGAAIEDAYAAQPPKSNTPGEAIP